MVHHGWVGGLHPTQSGGTDGKIGTRRELSAILNFLIFKDSGSAKISGFYASDVVGKPYTCHSRTIHTYVLACTVAQGAARMLSTFACPKIASSSFAPCFHPCGDAAHLPQHRGLTHLLRGPPGEPQQLRYIVVRSVVLPTRVCAPDMHRQKRQIRGGSCADCLGP